MLTKYLSPAGLYVNGSRRQLASCTWPLRSLDPVMNITGTFRLAHDSGVSPFSPAPCGDMATIARMRGSVNWIGGVVTNERIPPARSAVNAPYEWPATAMRE